MLKRFTVNNFMSFREKTTFDFTATNYHILEKSNTFEGITKGGIFVGANASGKSNGILALRLLLDWLFMNKNVDSDINGSFCLFSKNPLCSFEYEFEIDKNDIVYSIQYNRVSKSLIETLILNKNELLKRIGNSATSNISETSVFTDISEKTLLLREIYFSTRFRNNPILKKWFDFLSNSVFADLYERKFHSYSNDKLLLKEYLDNNGVGEINEFFKEFNFGQQIEYCKESIGTIVTIQSSEENSVFFKRDEIGEPIPFIIESLGNQNLLQLLPFFFSVIKKSGMLIIDEFSSGFHNQLEELLLKCFMEISQNSQFFFVSHSTNLLSNRFLRPDQIYTIDFHGKRGSTVNRVSKFQPREAQNIEKMYLGGVFNGLPKYSSECE